MFFDNPSADRRAKMIAVLFPATGAAMVVAGGLQPQSGGSEVVLAISQFMAFEPAVFWTAFAALFAIMNPIIAVPMFVDMTRKHSARGRRRLAQMACLSVMVIMTVAAVLGQDILAFFAISIGAFRISGGIVVLLMGLAMLKSESRGSSSDDDHAAEGSSMAICPIAMPLLAGPGAIATIIVQAQSASAPADYGMIAAVIVAIVAVTYATLSLAAPIAKAMGTTGLIVTSRIMGMIIAAIAIDMMVIGLGLSFPNLIG